MFVLSCYIYMDGRTEKVYTDEIEFDCPYCGEETVIYPESPIYYNKCEVCGKLTYPTPLALMNYKQTRAGYFFEVYESSRYD
jgi:predicted RNA-binding Zn-ribbon protein involved in translation (DUF1610 family)